jgi:hypothetical protein
MGVECACKSSHSAVSVDILMQIPHGWLGPVLCALQIWPEDLVPFRQVGRLTLNATTSNAFNEDTQLAFSPAHLVPGIDVSADRLLRCVLGKPASCSWQQHTCMRAAYFVVTSCRRCLPGGSPAPEAKPATCPFAGCLRTRMRRATASGPTSTCCRSTGRAARSSTIARTSP